MTVALRGSTSFRQTTAALTIPQTIPGSTAAGDIIVAWAASATTAPGWTWDRGFGAATYNPGTTGIDMGVLVTTAGSTDHGQVSTVTTGTSKRLACGMIVLSGASAVDVTPPFANGNSTSMDAPTVTPSRDHDCVLTIGVMLSNVSRASSWAGWGGSTPGPIDGNGSAGSGGVEFAAYYLLDNGANTGNPTGTLSTTTSLTGNKWLEITLLITQTAGGATVNGVAALTSLHRLTATAGASSGANAFYGSGGTWKTLNTFNGTAAKKWQ